MNAPRVPVYILAGGLSARFGSDKALARVGPDFLLARVARELAPVASVLVVVADRPGKYDALALTTIADDQPHLGPLGGIVRALADAASGWVLCAPCDLLGLREAWLRRLVAHAEDTGGGHNERVDAVAFRGPFWEGLPALYHTRLLDRARERLETEDRSLRGFLDHVHARALDLPAGWEGVHRITTPHDLRELTP